MDLSYTIAYKKGINNAAADALSRCPAPLSYDVYAISESVPTWLERLAAGYPDDATTSQLLQELILSNGSVRDFSLHNGIIKYKDRIWVGGNELA